MTQPNLEIAGNTVRAGARLRLSIPFGELPLGNPVQVPLVVLRGRHPGPTVWINAALHGDELNGIEIVRSVLDRVKARELAGTLLAVPIVNVHGFLNESRYLPDRRDLNRHFPGTRSGSLASRLAKWFMTEVVERSDYGIDLHTGSDHRSNYPQVRGDLQSADAREIMLAFGAPVAIHSKRRSGSLRSSAAKNGTPVIVYEGGEILRFNRDVIAIGVEGVLRVLEHLEMWSPDTPFEERSCIESYDTQWVRAKRSGLLRLEVELGEQVEKGQRLGVIEDILSGRYRSVKANCHGVIVGALANPSVYQGDAIIHIAQVDWVS